MKEDTDVAGQTHGVSFMGTLPQKKADACFFAANGGEIGFIQTKVGTQPEPEEEKEQFLYMEKKKTTNKKYICNATG